MEEKKNTHPQTPPRKTAKKVLHEMSWTKTKKRSYIQKIRAGGCFRFLDLDLEISFFRMHQNPESFLLDSLSMF